MKSVWVAAGVTTLAVAVFWTVFFLLAEPAPVVLEESQRVVRLEDEVEALRGQMRALQEEVRFAWRPEPLRIEEPAREPAKESVVDSAMLARLDRTERSLSSLTHQVDGVQEYLRYSGYEPKPAGEDQLAQAVSSVKLLQDSRVLLLTGTRRKDGSTQARAHAYLEVLRSLGNARKEFALSAAEAVQTGAAGQLLIYREKLSPRLVAVDDKQ